MNKLTKRTDVQGLDGYYHYTTSDGRKYSVVDFGTTMKTHPAPAGLFKGWEAMRIDHIEDWEESLTRAESWAELEKLL